MRRGLALVRVSKVGDRGDDLISPELQTTAITTYGVQRGIEIVDWIEALDESGSQRRSKWWPTLDAAISRLETEQLDCIVVYKFSRTARNRIKWAVALDRIETAGATLESATEGVDTATATGRFTRGMLAEINAYEAERIGEAWQEVKARRVRLGLADGQPRFGYDLVDGVHVPNDWAPTLRSLYEQKIAGVSAYTLTFWLAEQGAVTRYGNPYSQSGLVRMLDTGFAAGLIQTSGQHVPGAHEPIISADLWDAYLAQRTPTVRASSARYELSGLLRCAYCLKTMHAATRRGWPPGTLWVCSGQTKTKTCRGAQAWAPKVIRMLLADVEPELRRQQQLYEREIRRPKASKNHGQRLVAIEKELLALAEKNLAGFYDDETYLRLRAERLDEQRMLRKLDEEHPRPPATDALTALRELEGERRNGAWRTVLDHVVVRAVERPKYTPMWRSQ